MAINKPSVEEMNEKTPSTYTLVVEVSKLPKDAKVEIDAIAME